MGILFLTMGLLVCTYAKENGNRSLSKVEAEPSIYKMNINNISTFLYADGRADVDGGNSGFEFPKGSNKYAVYQSGFNWGGRYNGGEIRFGGSVFPSGLVTGKIGTDPELSRMYRVRPDWQTGSMLSEINDNEKSGDESAIREQYRLDWMEWPWQDGAPYLDADGNGQYDPDPDFNGTYDLGEDIPGFPGAGQTVYFIANASDGDKAVQFYGSSPQLIEMRVTVWGYASVGPLGNMLFKKYELANLGTEDYTDFYVAVWADPDVGNAGDDFVGCDTLLSLGYAYNSGAIDSQYGAQVPASGHDFFQGPIVPSPGSTALVNGEEIPDWKNLGMTAFYYFVNENGTPYSDPDLDNYSTGTLYFYNLLQGKIGSTGEYFPIPEELGGGVTPYPLSGDPVTGTGYVDGIVKPTKDRRYGMSSGPFTLVAGASQDIVIAQLVAQGASNLGSVTLLKAFDGIAQDAYNSNFVLPSAPPPPFVTYTVDDQEILIRWDSRPEMVAATEAHNLKGYSFQGYNVYQLPEASSRFETAVKIATYDIVDDIKVIVDNAVDPATGATYSKIVQNGNDWGIKRYFKVTKDAVNNNIDLFNGTRYYFAVTAYAYSPDELAVPNTLENTFSTFTIVPQTKSPGMVAQEAIPGSYTTTHVGNANASATVMVVDPQETTGHNYEISFNSQNYFKDYDGEWKFADASGTRINKTSDISPSYLAGNAVVNYDVEGTVDLVFEYHLDGPDGNWSDGIQITFPAGVVINGAEVDAFHGGAGTSTDVVIAGNVLTIGADSQTGDGPFGGGENITVNVNVFTPPMVANYVLWDDNWAGTTKVDASGSVTFDAINFATKTENHWNVKDLTTGEFILEDQHHLGGVDIYAEENANVGPDYTVAVDGMLINVDGSYAAPEVYAQVYLNGVPFPNRGDGSWQSAQWMITDYTWFGDPNGTANDFLGVGTLETSALQKDLEFRFTGEKETVTINGQTIEITKEGTGAMATLFGARGYSIANHPLNPNPGSATPFLIRVPMEVWNVDDNRQVNYYVYDRGQADPTANGFAVWNTTLRMYCATYDTPYTEDYTIDDDPNYSDDNFTWMNVWYLSDYTTGDVIKTEYANPLLLGVDKFTWTSAKPYVFDNEAAKADIEEINVFPNPYYGANPQELNKYQRFVTFSHLPDNATIRIFNLAGQLVKTIDKTSTDQFQRWDLTNTYNLPVASGVYVAYIDMPDIGTTKVLKLSIVQEQQVLDRF